MTIQVAKVFVILLGQCSHKSSVSFGYLGWLVNLLRIDSPCDLGVRAAVLLTELSGLRRGRPAPRNATSRLFYLLLVSLWG